MIKDFLKVDPEQVSWVGGRDRDLHLGGKRLRELALRLSREQRVKRMEVMFEFANNPPPAVAEYQVCKPAAVDKKRGASIRVGNGEILAVALLVTI
jgi:hypothetical protein